MDGDGGGPLPRKTVVLATTECLFEIVGTLFIELKCSDELTRLLADSESSCIVADEAFVSTMDTVNVIHLETGQLRRQLSLPWSWARLTMHNGHVYTFNENCVYELVDTTVRELCRTEVSISSLALHSHENDGRLKLFYQGEDFQLYAVTREADGAAVNETLILDEVITLIGVHEESVFVQTAQVDFVEIREDTPFWGENIGEAVDDWASCGPIVYLKTSEGYLHLIDTKKQHQFTLPHVPSGNLIVKQNV